MAESNNNSVIKTARLTKVFRDFWLREKVTAVADLDLDVRSKEVFGLLGPNGSGKSTTLKIILGLLFPTRGTVSVFGKRATDVSVKSRIGFLPEESYLYPFLDAKETLDFYGRLFHQPRQQRRRRIDMLLEMVGLTSVAYRRIGEYSKGMQRRIGLAQALINDPDLLILDEPTSGLDPIGTSQIKDIIRTLAQRGKTVLLSSHLLADVEDVCDRVAILYGGRERQVGDIDQLLARSDYTQIVTDRLDDKTIDRLRKVLEEQGKSLREVSAPRDKLESLFLRIVEEAQQQKMKTGGALGGGQVAEFLRGEDETQGRDVIESLVAAEEPEQKNSEDSQAESESAEAAKQEPATEVLQELISEGADTQAADEKNEPSESEPESKPESKPESEPESKPESEPESKPRSAPKQDQADRSMIEKLMKDDSEEDDR